ncbi:MAG: chlorite dismutase family protein [Actinomycetota bacterium]
MTEDRTLMRYALYRVDRAWRSLPNEERSLHKKEFATLLGEQAPCEAHAYSTVGLRGDTDFCLWMLAQDPSALQTMQAAINATALGRYLEQTHSYLAMTRKSQYLKGHSHANQELESDAGPRGDPYLFLYPMDKKREWYRLDFEERRSMMAEHFKIGHKYPGVKIHTGYSFGIDDQEFVVAFEGSSMSEFLSLVEELRGSSASAYTARDVPIFSCVRMGIDEILNQLG